jgi:DNA-binding HxlR family transcriptional regulator
MAAKRTYGDPCGIARALDVVGDRWALLVVRELLLGPKRFTDLRAGLPGLSADVLAQRLRQLEADGLLARRRLGPPAGTRVYELTERGRELEPVILALGRWGSAAPFPEPQREIGADSMVLALKTVFDPERAGQLEAEIELRLREHTFTVRVCGRASTSTRPLARARPPGRATASCSSASCRCSRWRPRPFRRPRRSSASGA